jgi:hypothetical protein
MDSSHRRVTTALSVHNERNDQLLLRQKGGLCCINLDGHVIYRYDISGREGGLAVDQQGHVYISGADGIHRLSPDGTFRIKILHLQNIKTLHL